MGKDSRRSILLPGGKTRISEAVVETIAMASAREIQGVMDIGDLARGAVMGGAVGGAVGLVSGGITGVVIGASTGSAAGATAAHIMARQRQRKTFHRSDEEIPLICLHLSAEYGADLARVAYEVRKKVQEAIYHRTGLAVHEVEVVFTEVVQRERAEGGFTSRKAV